MIYGNKWLSLAESTKEEVKDEYNIESLVYDEYLNRKSLLEACTDEAAKPILEAQVEVLREVSIKDIINKIKEAITNFLKWLKDLVMKAVNKIKEIINNAKIKKVEKLLGDIVGKKIKLKKVTVTQKESAIFTEDNSEESDNMPVNAFPRIHFNVAGKNCAFGMFYEYSINAFKDACCDDVYYTKNIADYLTKKKSISEKPIYDADRVEAALKKYKDIKFIIEPQTTFEDPEDNNVRDAAREYGDNIRKMEELLSVISREFEKYYKDESAIEAYFEKGLSLLKDNPNNKDLELPDKDTSIYREVCSQYIKLGKEIGSYYQYVIGFLTTSHNKLVRKAAAFINWCVDNDEKKAIKSFMYARDRYED